ncbi:TonB-dependent receptor plug domain-containing protein [Caulobacter endophyticus]|uniref:TonB-dependent receptor plug domain-containing protein n=1 Tax=Caulobacter endophyticus TaxID=2172652 RepID=UPI00240F5DFF|nr:TonB-dependent receptor [Caulobacter endophyticus]MDG2531424.1 TonB-dependent receptor [Caulobacter endophyticus]
MRLVSLLALAAAVPALALPAYALADDAAAVDQIVVTAGREPEKLSEVSTSTTVIDAETLKRTQAVVVSDLLSRTPGVTVTRNGGVGGTTQLRIRGAETDQTVVLIDGVKLNDPASTGGGYNFATLLAGNLNRIEVLRGSQSTLWGSQAIGGVVNLLTATPNGPLSTSVSAEAGSRDTAYGHAALGAGGDWGGFRLAGAYYTTDGVSAFGKSYGGKEKDGYRNAGLSGRLDLNVTDWAAVDLRASYASAKNEFDATSGDTAEYGKTKELVSYAGVRTTHFDGMLKNRLGFSYTQIDRDNFNPGTATPVTFDARGQNTRYEYQGTWTISDELRAVFGAESERSRFRSVSPWSGDPNPKPAPKTASTDSLYLQLQAKPISGLTLTGGVRQEDHSAFGEASVLQAGATYSPNGGVTVFRANYGEGFKAPSLYQLYSIYGDKTLQPEESESVDLGVEHSVLNGRVRAAVTWFHRDITNQIDFVSTNTPPNYGGYANFAKTETSGVELETTIEVTPALVVSANYTNMDPINRSAGSVGKRLPRRAGETANLNADYDWKSGLTTGLSIQYVGDSFDNATNTRRLKSYALFDLRASYPVNETFEVYGRVENLFDKEYQTIYRYGSVGRGFFAGVRAKF